MHLGLSIIAKSLTEWIGRHFRGLRSSYRLWYFDDNFLLLIRVVNVQKSLITWKSC